ncbi:MAG: NfeD family protein [Dehalococcoidales bacterium]|jgi:membrane-bound ClpP family serine protease|nr:NfeD family protein [Dehalococcoidales bacterium]MDP6738252.1 NfeD family protein [Dehalococcoidales bacterium]|tara:strand:- start:2445 stop:2858 length:414 start_codon:yes stop_codon:yes gene_type:complete
MTRLIFAIISALLEEAALVVIVLWGLPTLGVHIPLPGLIVLMALLITYSVFTYRLVGRTLKLQGKSVVGLSSLVGDKGQAVTPLAPEGMVKIKGELWVAYSVDGMIKSGETVKVVGQEKLKLLVRCRRTTSSAAGTK